MRYALEFSGDSTDVAISLSGRASVSGYSEMNLALVADERFQAGMSILVDQSDLDPRGLTTDDVHKIARAFESIAGALGDSLIAIVAPAELSFGLVRQALLMAHADQDRVRVFRDLGTAQAWLQAADP